MLDEEFLAAGLGGPDRTAPPARVDRGRGDRAGGGRGAGRAGGRGRVAGIETLIAAGRGRRWWRPRRRPSPPDHPDVGHDGQPEGGPPLVSDRPRSPRRPALDDPAAPPRHDPDRGAHVPRLGPVPPGSRPPLRQHAGPAPAVRSRRDPPADRGGAGDGAGPGAGDAAADHGAPRVDPSGVRHLVASGHRPQRLGAAGNARGAGHGRLRRRRLQPVRIDRGGVGVHRHACRPSPGPGHRGAAPSGHRGQVARRRPPAGGPG